jgi:hypothetical protein
VFQILNSYSLKSHLTPLNSGLSSVHYGATRRNGFFAFYIKCFLIRNYYTQ